MATTMRLPAGETLANDAYIAIRKMIVRLTLKPGALVSEASLSSELGLGKTPIREALRRLHREHLVEVLPRTGYRISPVTIRGAKELFAMRVLLEGESAALAAKNLVDASRLHQLEAAMKAQVWDDNDPETIDNFLDANTRFHMTVAEIAGNTRLTEALQVVLTELQRLQRVELEISARTREHKHEHSKLVSAILSGDAEDARQIAVAQARSMQKLILTALFDSERVQSLNLVHSGG